MKQPLHQQLDEIGARQNAGFYKDQVPATLYQNLRYSARPYQQEALGRFAWILHEFPEKSQPMQLLFHMATGSGKTLVMAGLLLYLYERGYRNFLFFVNSSNIIEKTRENFLNRASSKYLFADSISLAGKRVRIREVENFQEASPEDINIVFSTIQGLHSRLNTPRENSLTFDDFEEQKLVLLSDEAHHINAETKKGSELNAEEKEEAISWEGTVNRIFQAHPDNLLLEFTATADLAHPEIARKYSQKLLFDYPLRQFRKDGYSKEVKVLQADLPAFERALQAVVLSQYRRKLFERYRKPIKPVLLFKSKTIKDSHAFFGEFVQGIKSLKKGRLEQLKRNAAQQAGDQQLLFGDDGSHTLYQAFRYFEQEGILLENLLAELQDDFSEDKLISVNSKEESEQKQLAINSLEDEQNAYRAVFAVDKLNEGWDVLNLFDIVRLYDTRDAKNGKPGKTTMSEAQLIGRGARYCPFRLEASQPLDKRKFDEKPTHELRVCEELYYHSAYNPRYVQELHVALEEIGMTPEEGEKRNVSGARGTVSKVQRHRREDLTGLPRTILEHVYEVRFHTGYTQSSPVFGTSAVPIAKAESRLYLLPELGQHVIRKAMSRLPFYQFDSLQKKLPSLRSVSEFIASEAYLGGVQLKATGRPEQLQQLTQEEKLYLAQQVLEGIAKAMAKEQLS
ncbi:DEAD/DEAH box helicase family protein [Pontibacter sp. JH31]|uniref:DEAD/DEAH box helicase family protein n=1 Tax=Pontibacter aquaedesilientis TaxID=2766980 RepID=A0ABR7XF23_9BACT|nr:DEAD/DEAH box helicase family protein [Pontibacter aquaedesilientis]MBD1396893.1 DEAD/DEAH box helicase family protein [Pontibacter aquaedesilientis]